MALHKQSKFAVNDLLFKPEPPVIPRDVKGLFCGRAAELERGRETLKANLDIEGRRSKRSGAIPLLSLKPGLSSSRPEKRSLTPSGP